MRQRTAHQVRDFVSGLEAKKERFWYESEYSRSSYWRKITIKVKNYLDSLYLNGSGDNLYSFDFELDMEDINYFIEKYKPMLVDLEEKEKREELRRLEDNKVKLEEKINKLKENGK